MGIAIGNEGLDVNSEFVLKAGKEKYPSQLAYPTCGSCYQFNAASALSAFKKLTPTNQKITHTSLNDIAQALEVQLFGGVVTVYIPALADGLRSWCDRQVSMEFLERVCVVKQWGALGGIFRLDMIRKEFEMFQAAVSKAYKDSLAPTSKSVKRSTAERNRDIYQWYIESAGKSRLSRQEHLHACEYVWRRLAEYDFPGDEAMARRCLSEITIRKIVSSYRVLEQKKLTGR